MVFIQARTDRSGLTSYQLVESQPTRNQEEAQVLLHLEKFASLEAALEQWPREIGKARAWAAECRGKAALHTGRRAGGYRDGSSSHRQWLALAQAAVRRIQELERKMAWLKDYLRSNPLPLPQGKESVP